jgi:hypothetical protein
VFWIDTIQQAQLIVGVEVMWLRLDHLNLPNHTERISGYNTQRHSTVDYRMQRSQLLVNRLDSHLLAARHLELLHAFGGYTVQGQMPEPWSEVLLTS